jgi:hypothetical protein
MGGLSKEAQRHVQVGAAKRLRLRSTKTKAITAAFAASLVRYKLLPRLLVNQGPNRKASPTSTHSTLPSNDASSLPDLDTLGRC